MLQRVLGGRLWNCCAKSLDGPAAPGWAGGSDSIEAAPWLVRLPLAAPSDVWAGGACGMLVRPWHGRYLRHLHPLVHKLASLPHLPPPATRCRSGARHWARPWAPPAASQRASGGAAAAQGAGGAPLPGAAAGRAAGKILQHFLQDCSAACALRWNGCACKGREALLQQSAVAGCSAGGHCKLLGIFAMHGWRVVCWLSLATRTHANLAALPLCCSTGRACQQRSGKQLQPCRPAVAAPARPSSRPVQPCRQVHALHAYKLWPASHAVLQAPGGSRPRAGQVSVAGQQVVLMQGCFGAPQPAGQRCAAPLATRPPATCDI